MPRILSIWLPQLPLDRLARQSDARLDGPFAITAEERNAWRITHPNQTALSAGVVAGQSLADARAVCPDLLTEPSDPAREGLLLQALWRWADCLSPRVAISPPDSLMLDITGCAHLFGSEAEMAADARTRLTDLQITSRIGIADTKRAARALAEFGTGHVSIAAAGETTSALASLPVRALRLPDVMVADLARAGLTTIAHLLGQPSSALARRFGLELTKALGASTGIMPDPVTPKAAEPVYAARMSLPDPIGYLEDVEAVLARLAAQVCKRLEADQRGARQFHLTVRCVDTGDHHFSIGFARPCFEAEAISRQFAYPLSKLEIEYGADWFRLVAAHIEPIRLRQMALGEDTKQNTKLIVLLETIGNRIGFDHVRIFEPSDSHAPEAEFRQVQALGCTSNWKPSPRLRPIRLFNPPEIAQVERPGRPPLAFKWRRMHFTANRVDGPERITPRWHSDTDLRTRDYWKVQTEQGRRLWLVTYPGSATQDWFVAGEFA